MVKAFKEDVEYSTDVKDELNSKENERGLNNETFDDDNLELDTGDDNDQIVVETIDKETVEFDENEVDHQITFAKYNRISCFAHSLQLVVSQFDKVSPFPKVIKKAKKLVAKFNKSTKATERLITLEHKKFISDCPTKWSSTFLLLKRLLNTKEGVCKIVEDLEWNGLQTSDWKRIETVVELLEPFAEYTTLCCGDSYTTLSAVVPIIMELNCHLQEIQKKPGMTVVVKCLLKDMHKRFDCLTDILTLYQIRLIVYTLWQHYLILNTL